MFSPPRGSIAAYTAVCRNTLSTFPPVIGNRRQQHQLRSANDCSVSTSNPLWPFLLRTCFWSSEHLDFDEAGKITTFKDFGYGDKNGYLDFKTNTTRLVRDLSRQKYWFIANGLNVSMARCLNYHYVSMSHQIITEDSKGWFNS